LQHEAVALANELEDPDYGPRLLRLAQSEATNGEVRANAVVALGATGQAQYAPVLSRLAEDTETVPSIRIAAIRGLTRLQPPDLEPRMKILVLSDAPNEVRSEALRALGRRESGLSLILDLEESQQLPAELRTLATLLVNTSPDEQIAKRARTVLPPLVGKGESQVRNPRAYINRQGDPGRGREIFFAKDGARCTTCHGLEGDEQRAGPNLATIGSKLGKEALADAILNPSAGIAHGYDTWIIETKTQGLVTGVLVEDTPERIVLRTETNDEIRLSAGEITSRRKSNLSMMPEDLITHMTDDDLVNLLEFLTTLKADGATSSAE